MLARFKQLNTASKSVYGAAFLLATFTLISQLTGLIRDRLLAYSFGAGNELDIYYASFRIPDFILTLVGSIVAVSVIVPFIASYVGKDKELRNALGTLFSVFLMIISAVSVVVYYYMGEVTVWLFPGFNSTNIESTISLSRILLLSPILLGISNFLGAIAQAKNYFLAYAISPILYNCGIVIGILFLVPRYGLPGLAWGVIIGAFMHLLVQTPYLIKERLLPWPRIPRGRQMILKVFSISALRTCALSMNHISTLVLIGFASTIATGAIAVFNLSTNLQSVLVSVFGSSVSLAAFPILSSMHQEGRKKDFEQHVSNAILHVLFWVVPAFVFLVILRAHIVRVVLGAGMFSWTDTRLTSASLALLALSAVFQCVGLVLTRAFYSMGKTTLPLLANLSSLIVSVLSAIVLLGLDKTGKLFSFYAVLRIEDISSASIVLLSLAYSLGAIVSSVVLVALYVRNYTLLSHVGTSLFEVSVSAITGGVVTYVCLNIMGDVVGLESLWKVFIQGFVAGIAGIVTSASLLSLVKNSEYITLMSSLEKRVWRKASPVYPDAEVV